MPQHELRNHLAARARAQYRAGWSLPAYHYQAPECYANDLAVMREKFWWLAGHESQIAKPGDYKLYQFAQESILLVRDKTGAVNAFYNVCRHRGSPVCREEHGRASVLVCPYHGWSYKLDGTLLPPSNMPQGFDPKGFGLKRCHVRTLDGLIFVSLALGQPADFEEFAARLRPFLEPYALRRTKAVAEERYPSVSNWKVSIENFAECYHCPGAHRDMMRVLSQHTPKPAIPGEAVESWTGRMQRLRREVEPIFDGASSPHLQQAVQMELQPGSLTFTRGGQPCSKLLGDMTEWTGGWTLMSFNPFVHAFLFDDFAHFLCYTPMDVEKTDGKLLWLVREDAVEGAGFDREALTGLARQVMLEDVRITDEVQGGIASSAYSPAPLSREEGRIVSFHDWYFNHFVPAAPPEIRSGERVSLAG